MCLEETKEFMFLLGGLRNDYCKSTKCNENLMLTNLMNKKINVIENE